MSAAEARAPTAACRCPASSRAQRGQPRPARARAETLHSHSKLQRLHRQCTRALLPTVNDPNSD